jgi:dihydrolipoamide dehydrogenase
VTGAKAKGAGVLADVEPVAKGGAAETIIADIVLVAIGRSPYTASAWRRRSCSWIDKRGRIATDGHFATNVPGIYAIGDVIIGPMLAHKAEEEGVGRWPKSRRPERAM